MKYAVFACWLEGVCEVWVNQVGYIAIRMLGIIVLAMTFYNVICSVRVSVHVISQGVFICKGNPNNSYTGEYMRVV